MGCGRSTASATAPGVDWPVRSWSRLSRRVEPRDRLPTRLESARRQSSTGCAVTSYVRSGTADDMTFRSGGPTDWSSIVRVTAEGRSSSALATVTTRWPGALHFHHVDPREKAFVLSQ